MPTARSAFRGRLPGLSSCLFTSTPLDVVTRRFREEMIAFEDKKEMTIFFASMV
jgi:hypothetical protein